ncbi:hybrid sensor histidine kinase/response regulator [Thalassotalea marina]|uniref:histidine kinase n=1 Tax=Thalassotalea marina TaxID=1673741 RepID=A0A919BII0_9GAMM|nr:ATP-binding protein [Thalassotalea marina]GHF93310.1 hypothetical protein GCM10017161_22020 [Thalassotalea marina]
MPMECIDGEILPCALINIDHHGDITYCNLNALSFLTQIAVNPIGQSFSSYLSQQCKVDFEALFLLTDRTQDDINNVIQNFPYIEFSDGTRSGFHLVKKDFGYYIFISLFETNEQSVSRTCLELKFNDDNDLITKSFNLIENYLTIGCCSIDLQSDEMTWSKGMYNLHHLQQGEHQVTPDIMLSYIANKDQALLKDNITKAKVGGVNFRQQVSLLYAQESEIKVEVIGKVEHDATGNPKTLLCIYRNISESFENLKKLKLLSSVNTSKATPVYFINEQDNVIFTELCPSFDEKSASLFGYINFSVQEYLKLKQQAKKFGEIKQQDISFDNYNAVFDLHVIYEAKCEVYIWVVEDVTERFRKEQQQIISNRLALLGNTFGTVSHDINNVLGVALGATEMLELKVAQGEQNIAKYIERVKNAIDKGKSVTERLLAFTRKPTVKVVEFNPIQEIEENLYLFKQLLLSTINFTFVKEDFNCLIRFPQGEFTNILLNIVLNAQDAIREQGLVGTIEVSAKLVQKSYIEITVTDSGIGIDSDSLVKIFDPFFSSKSVNKGNGIGLANVYSTMHKHNGEIEVDGSSELGGAKFTLRFKCKLIEPSPLTSSSSNRECCFRNKSILVVDDEVSIAEFVSLFLTAEGAVARYATNKIELLQLLAENNHFDMLITDMILPDTSGREIVNLVKEKHPNIKIFSMSGYIGEENTAWHYPVLQKPFNSLELTDFLKNN